MGASVALYRGRQLRADYAGLDEELAEIAVVIATEVRKGAWIARRRWNYKTFCSAIGQMPENRMFAMPHKQPSAAFKQGVAHFVDFGVV